jgi:hypothetical protein
MSMCCSPSRNFFKVELWTRDGQHVERLLFVGNNLDEARDTVRCLRQEAPRAQNAPFLREVFGSVTRV